MTAWPEVSPGGCPAHARSRRTCECPSALRLCSAAGGSGLLADLLPDCSNPYNMVPKTPAAVEFSVSPFKSVGFASCNFGALLLGVHMFIIKYNYVYCILIIHNCI